PRHVRGPASRESAHLRPRTAVRRRRRALRPQHRALRAGGRARPLALGGARARRDARPVEVPADRRAALPAHARAARLVLVPVDPGRGPVVIDERALIEYVTAQRWFGSRGSLGSAPS